MYDLFYFGLFSNFYSLPFTVIKKHKRLTDTVTILADIFVHIGLDWYKTYRQMALWEPLTL